MRLCEHVFFFFLPPPSSSSSSSSLSSASYSSLSGHRPHLFHMRLCEHGLSAKPVEHLSKYFRINYALCVLAMSCNCWCGCPRLCHAPHDADHDKAELEVDLNVAFLKTLSLHTLLRASQDCPYFRIYKKGLHLRRRHLPLAMLFLETWTTPAVIS